MFLLKIHDINHIMTFNIILLQKAFVCYKFRKQFKHILTEKHKQKL